VVRALLPRLSGGEPGRPSRHWRHAIGLLAIGVTQTGRIIIRMQGAGDRPGPPDWTAHAPRAPWLRLDLTRLASAHSDAQGAPHLAMDCHWTVFGRVLDQFWTVSGPFLLEPG
jgi:hypothetical protein